MNVAFFWSKHFLTNRIILWCLFWFNLLGTIYGYIWYGPQLRYTYENSPVWQLVFVPDSPTASLFFTIAVLFLLYPPVRSKFMIGLRKIVEGLAVITSVKYGIWAVAIIFAGAAQGNMLVWQDWMLVASHTAMAVEALLFVRFFSFGTGALVIGLLWTLLNDTVDYTFHVFPTLPGVLMDDLAAVRNFTFGLTIFSFVCGYAALRAARAIRQRK
ncbi:MULTISPECIES: DUF1405 domain-containing protein [unclassified Paenibacillus]|uniref:DUF1405 domain-containing protein n=1 Tax=unclassified Paenibacillus TaxID=185978 RepID=UPI001C0FFDCD|nr:MULTISPECIES: DUF1405 domain-containing protein [unclassified Paenibacillus]MBU5443993.1 DUF1405 domain-containing protein [Paenibacillus sp. MSJ-34]CAH0118774.1 hypothetical protein PAE9249_01268 [Paenibacillus sp. CECT 9249]